MLKWDHWHIELSSICTLKCPRCPRAEIPESLLNQQLSLKFFQEQLGADIIQQIKKITFCGNDGDSIYCRDFLEICRWIKSINKKIQLILITNGSYKSTEWWQKLGEIFDDCDEIHWSIDGWDHASNYLYRINSDWQSILGGIHSFKKYNHSTYCVWATIAFRFNENDLEKIKTLAIDMGMDSWQLTKSTKFGSHYPEIYGIDDPLCPTTSELISPDHRFERISTDISGKERPGKGLKEIFWQRGQDLIKKQKYSGICLIGNKGIFLNSRGEFFPCCWTANRYDHNSSWHQLAKTKFNLWNRTFTEIINDSYWQDEFLNFDSFECRTKCTPDKLKNFEHITEW
jgi:MoaA/NifB/PqqE/SkfB family radical SAM enzyme